MSRSARFTRRTFTRATGLSLALLPLLEADKIVRAAASDSTNLVTIAWPNGVRATEWWPDAHKDPDYLLDESSGVTETNFSFANRKISGPLEPHKQDLLFFLFAGLTAKVEGGHESGPEMFKVSDGNTLDQHVARDHTTPFKTLNLAVQKQDNRGHIFKDGQGVTLEQDPYAVFDRLFQGGALDPSVLAEQHATRGSVLDYVHKQLDGYGKILGSSDRQRIEFHLNSIRELEKRLASGGGVTTVDGAPESLPEARFDPKDVSNFNLATRAMFDLVVLALASGATRAATILLSDGDAAGLAMPWLGPEFALDTGSDYLGIQNNHHGHSHVIDEIHHQMQRWFVSEFAEFIRKLKETPGPTGGTLLDQSAVLCMNNMNTGGGHGTHNLPTFLAGKCGGYFKTGRYIKYPEWEGNHDGIKAAIANAMGTPLDGWNEDARLRV